MRFKAELRNQDAKTGIPAQLLLQDFFLERFLSRVCASDVRHHFMFKGGVVLTGLLGLSRRTTMDIDATLREAELSEKNAMTLVNRVCKIDTEDGVTFSVVSAAPIRKNDQYGGFRIKVSARFESVTGQVSIDVSTGDAIPGGPVEHDLPSQFKRGVKFRIFGYPVESILAEKTEAVFSLGELGTRPRDYYDIYMIVKHVPYSKSRFRNAYHATTEHRKTATKIADMPSRLEEFAKSEPLNSQWEKYRKQFAYAEKIPFLEVISALEEIVGFLQKPGSSN